MIMLEPFLALPFVPRLHPRQVMHVTLIFGSNVVMAMLLSVTTPEKHSNLRGNAIVWQVNSFVQTMLVHCLVRRPLQSKAKHVWESFSQMEFFSISNALTESSVAPGKEESASRTGTVIVAVTP